MVTRINFTFALMGGLWIEFSDGHRDWYSFNSPEARALDSEYVARAARNAGMWTSI